VRKYFQPASFFVKETSMGLYTSSYPLMFPEWGIPLESFEAAVDKWKIWHPETKLLFTPQKYLSYRLHDGKSYREVLKQNLIHVSLDDNSCIPDSKYKFIVLPLTYRTPIDLCRNDYSEWSDGLLSSVTRYYNTKLIFFGSYQAAKAYAEKVVVEFVEWWESSGQLNMLEYEKYYNEAYNDASNFENLYKESDSWMDDPENYWNID